MTALSYERVCVYLPVCTYLYQITKTRFLQDSLTKKKGQVLYKFSKGCDKR